MRRKFSKNMRNNPAILLPLKNGMKVSYAVIAEMYWLGFQRYTI